MSPKRPNVLIVLTDDMGYSDLGCFGGEIDTPNYNRLAEGGVRFTQCYSTPRCSPTRSCLLTGVQSHLTGIGILTGRDCPDGYPGDLNRKCVTIAEALRGAGYSTYMSGKWHLAADVTKANGAWPTERGFEKYYGIILGAADYFQPNTLCRGTTNIEAEIAGDRDYYLTDAIADNASAFIRGHARERAGNPFFLYTAFTAPHWPLHAKPEDIAKYKGRFDAGWDKLREARIARMRDMGLLDRGWALSGRDSGQPPWEEAPDKEWQLRRMECYAAQIDRADQGLGRILRALEETGQLANTLILCLSDNGGSAEELAAASWEGFIRRARIANEKTRDGAPVKIGNDPRFMPGSQETYQSYGVPWANLSNTPFRMYKIWVHEGGIATHLIAHWPEGITDRGGIRRQLAHVLDVMPTAIDVSGAAYPKSCAGHDIFPLEGASLAPIFANRPNGRAPIFWEHEGNAAMREGKWKLVKSFMGWKSAMPSTWTWETRGAWELYDMEVDRTELDDLAAKHPERVASMSAAWDAWAKRSRVIDREIILRSQAAERERLKKK